MVAGNRPAPVVQHIHLHLVSGITRNLAPRARLFFGRATSSFYILIVHLFSTVLGWAWVEIVATVFPLDPLSDREGPRLF